MYKTTHFVFLNLQSFFTNLENFILSLEWELYDTVSEYNKVYRITGETVRDYTMYVNIYISGTTSVWFAPYTNWNNITHIGTHSLSPYQLQRSFTSYSDIENQADFFCCGTKDYLMFIYGSYVNGVGKFVGNYGVGFIPNVIYQMKQTCNTAISPGTNVTLQLDNIGSLKKNQIYQISDKTGTNGCEIVTITNVDSGTNTITLSSVVNSYPNGIYIGVNIFNIFYINGYTMFDMWSFNKIGTAYNAILKYLQCDILHGYNGSTAPGTNNVRDHINPSFLLNRPLFKKENSIYPCGYFNSEILTWRSYVERNYVRTFIGVNNDNTPIKTNYSYPTTVDNNLTYIEDIRKNWAVDSLIGKYIGFIAGSGAWQTRKILSNTATRITFVNTLHELVDFTSQYIIVDRVYRVITTYATESVNLVALDTF